MSDLSSNFDSMPSAAVSAVAPLSDMNHSQSMPPLSHMATSALIAASVPSPPAVDISSRNAIHSTAPVPTNASAAPTDNIAKTPNLQSNMYKMQRNRSN